MSARLFLKNISSDRKSNLTLLFRNLGYHLFTGVLLFGSYYLLHQIRYSSPTLARIIAFIGFCTVLGGAIIFVKVCRIILLEYLFLSHMSASFPALLVNLFTLLLSMILAAWIGAEIFNIHLTPILATSAIFSLVLGLALQDTLGNLFAGVALQIDKPYEIGDWVEIQSNGQKRVGQVYDISWRATTLIGFTEEYTTVPNRIMSQAEISNYTTRARPIIRGLTFRLPFDVDPQQVKEILVRAAKSVTGIRRSPAPASLVFETTESWIGFRVVYFLDNFGEQYGLADQIYMKAISDLKKVGISLAGQKVVLTPDDASSADEPSGTST